MLGFVIRFKSIGVFLKCLLRGLQSFCQVALQAQGPRQQRQHLRVMWVGGKRMPQDAGGPGKVAADLHLVVCLRQRTHALSGAVSRCKGKFGRIGRSGSGTQAAIQGNQPKLRLHEMRVQCCRLLEGAKRV